MVAIVTNTRSYRSLIEAECENHPRGSATWEAAPNAEVPSTMFIHDKLQDVSVCWLTLVCRLTVFASWLARREGYWVVRHFFFNSIRWILPKYSAKYKEEKNNPRNKQTKKTPKQTQTKQSSRTKQKKTKKVNQNKTAKQKQNRKTKQNQKQNSKTKTKQEN